MRPSVTKQTRLEKKKKKRRKDIWHLGALHTHTGVLCNSDWFDLCTGWWEFPKVPKLHVHQTIKGELSSYNKPDRRVRDLSIKYGPYMFAQCWEIRSVKITENTCVGVLWLCGGFKPSRAGEWCGFNVMCTQTEARRHLADRSAIRIMQHRKGEALHKDHLWDNGRKKCNMGELWD